MSTHRIKDHSDQPNLFLAKQSKQANLSFLCFKNVKHFTSFGLTKLLNGSENGQKRFI